MAEKPKIQTTTMRLPTCVEAWPDCSSGAYDPRCCRFPKSCSCETPAWYSEPIFDAIVDELIGIKGNPFDIVIEPGEARLVAARIIGRLRHLGRENDHVGSAERWDAGCRCQSCGVAWDIEHDNRVGW